MIRKNGMVVISDDVCIPLSTVKDITIEYEKYEVEESLIKKVCE